MANVTPASEIARLRESGLTFVHTKEGSPESVYKLVLRGVFETSLKNSKAKVDSVVGKIAEAWKTTALEEKIIRRGLMVENLVYSVFVVCDAKSTFLSTACLEFLLRDSFAGVELPLLFKLNLQACVLGFEQGVVDHFNLRMSFLRIREKTTDFIRNGIGSQMGFGHVHLDPAARIYENFGMHSNHMQYGASAAERKRLRFIDEISDKATRVKRRLLATHRIWRGIEDKRQFFNMVSKSLPAEDRMAVSLCMAMAEHIASEPW